MGGAPKTYVVVIDTPSVKQFVFGTDALAESRGASALLDRLHREDLSAWLRAGISQAGGELERVYAGGGSAQFLFHDCALAVVERVVAEAARRFRIETGGEVRLAYGIAELESVSAYRHALRTAHFRMRSQREMGCLSRATPLLPFMKECESASHLPAIPSRDWGPEGRRALSDASCRKREEARRAKRHGAWAKWMSQLAENGPWPHEDDWAHLRPASSTKIGDCSQRRGYVGLVYADGNRMGQVVQQLDDPAIFRQFSEIVDQGICEACHTALERVCSAEIAHVRANRGGHDILPADILLAGGDDLLVMLPADRALWFAAQVSEQFERVTQHKMARLNGKSRSLLERLLSADGLTISCGVALARANYPFYLLLELAEALLGSAKRGGLLPPGSGHASPSGSRIDFHLVSGASSHELEYVRERDYCCTSGNVPRTLRPYTRDGLARLRAAASTLRRAGFPRSKLHALQEASLDPLQHRAQERIREIFARCQHAENRSQRRALWEAIEHLTPEGFRLDFPWYERNGQRTMAVADLVEVYELVGAREVP